MCPCVCACACAPVRSIERCSLTVDVIQHIRQTTVCNMLKSPSNIGDEVWIFLNKIQQNCDCYNCTTTLMADMTNRHGRACTSFVVLWALITYDAGSVKQQKNKQATVMHDSLNVMIFRDRVRDVEFWVTSFGRIELNLTCCSQLEVVTLSCSRLSWLYERLPKAKGQFH